MKFENIVINLNNITLYVTGNYYKEDLEVGLSKSFEIEKITSKEENLYELLSNNNPNYIEEIENKCLEKMTE